MKTQMTDYQSNNLVLKTFAEHIRKHPGMHIGKCGDGSCDYDGLYTLLIYALESVVNSDPSGNVIYIDNTDQSVSITWKSTECTDCFFPDPEKMQPLDSNGYMISSIAALSSIYELVLSNNESSTTRRLVYDKGYLRSDHTAKETSAKDVFSLRFTLDDSIFATGFYYRDEITKEHIKRFSTTNPTIRFQYNGMEVYSPRGMKDFIEWKFDDLLLPTIHLTGEGIDVAINAPKGLSGKVKNQYTSYNQTWNGIYSPETKAFITATVATLNKYFGLSLDIKDYYGIQPHPADERHSQEYYRHEEKFPANLVGALWIQIENPLHISNQGKTLGSKWMNKTQTITVEDFISGFIETELPVFLDANPETAKRLKTILIRDLTSAAELI